MKRRHLKRKLIRQYLDIACTNVSADEYSIEELAGYFLYNCSEEELKMEISKKVKMQSVKKQKAWNLIKKAIFPYTYRFR